MSFSTFNILDLVEQIGTERVESILGSFSCPLNSDIEDFVHHNAIQFAQQKTSVTYLVFNDDMELAGFFSLAGKVLSLSNGKLSKNRSKENEPIWFAFC